MTTNYEKQEPGGLYRSVTDVWTSECSTSSVILQKGSLVTLLRVTPGDYFANVQFFFGNGRNGARRLFKPRICLECRHPGFFGTL